MHGIIESFLRLNIFYKICSRSKIEKNHDNFFLTKVLLSLDSILSARRQCKALEKTGAEKGYYGSVCGLVNFFLSGF